MLLILLRERDRTNASLVLYLDHHLNMLYNNSICLRLPNLLHNDPYLKTWLAIYCKILIIIFFI